MIRGTSYSAVLGRIKALCENSLTGHIVARDFVRNRIAPLQARGQPVWHYQGITDKMRLHSSKTGEKAVALLIKQLFAIDSVEPLPEFFMPLYENDRHGRILMKILACDRWGLISEGVVNGDHPNPLVGQPCPSGDSADGSEDIEDPEDAAWEATSSSSTTEAPPPAGRKHGKALARERVAAQGIK